MDIDVTIPVEGRSVSQARAVAHVGDTEILTVNAALGHRDARGRRASSSTMPDVPAAGGLPERPSRPGRPRHGVHRGGSTAPAPAARQFDELRRHAVARRPLGAVGPRRRPARHDRGQAGDPRRLRPVRHRARPSARQIGGNSLDNTLRVVRLVPTEWVLHRHRVPRPRPRLRPRPRPPLGPGRHPARHRQPVHHRPRVERTESRARGVAGRAWPGVGCRAWVCLRLRRIGPQSSRGRRRGSGSSSPPSWPARARASPSSPGGRTCSTSSPDGWPTPTASGPRSSPPTWPTPTAGPRWSPRSPTAASTIDVLVNNAGFSTTGPVAPRDPEAEMRLVRVDVEAVVDLCSRVVPGHGRAGPRRGAERGVDRRLPAAAGPGRLRRGQGLRPRLHRRAPRRAQGHRRHRHRRSARVR